MKLSGAQVLLECLKEQGVEYIFGYPGGAVLPIYDALYSYKELTHILTAHEQGASHAADGYARSTGKVGVVLATSGPGATNTVTGIATAYRDSAPIVVITGQVAQSLIGKASFQEVDIKSITASITKKNYLVDKVDDLQSIVREAFKIAKSGRPGPVLIDIPKNIQTEMTEYTPEVPVTEEENSEYMTQDFLAQIKNAAELINSCSKPVIFAGGGVTISGANSELLDLAERIKAPVTCSLMGMGAFPQNHPNYIGMIGMHGNRYSNYAVSQCDLLIAIGTRFSDRVVSNVNSFAKNAKIIHIDIDPNEFGKNVRTNLPLKGDVKKVLSVLNDKIEQKETSSWNLQINDWMDSYPLKYKGKGGLNPQTILDTLYRLTSGDCIVTTEVGQNQIWTAQYFTFLKPRTFISSCGLGTMGYGLGAAIGSALGNPGKKVINVAGDGSFKMNSTELATISKFRVPVIQLVLNNHALGMVHQWQEMFYAGRYSATELGPDVDFIKLASAYGIKGFKITSNEEVEEVLKEVLALNEPVVVECDLDAFDKVLPIVPPGADITSLIDNTNAN